MEGSSPQQRVQEGPSTPSRGLTTTFCPQKMAIPELASRQEIQGDLQQAFIFDRNFSLQGSSGPPSSTVSPQTSPRDVKFLGFNFSPFGSPTTRNNKNNSLIITNGKPNGVDPFLREKSPKRSRSLIRRSSRKAKQQVQNVHNPDDCVVS